MKHRDGTTQNMRAQRRRKNHQRETDLNVSASIRVSREGAEEMSLDIPSYRTIQGDGKTGRIPRGPILASFLRNHGGAVGLTTHSGGFLGLWSGLSGRKRFPVRFLAESKQTLREFIEAARLD
jgi:hypothetical protein